MPSQYELTELGRAIRRAREEKGLSQEELVVAIKKSTGADVSQGAITAIERGKTKQPRTETIDHLAFVLGLDPEGLKVLAGMRRPDAISGLPDSQKVKRIHFFTSQLLQMPDSKVFRVIEIAELVAGLDEQDQEKALRLLEGMVDMASHSADNIDETGDGIY